jgi:hypothetical protein
MDTHYQIAKWREKYETSDSRKHKTLTWISIPIEFGADYYALIEEFGDEAGLMESVWFALLRIAASNPVKDRRGVLVNDNGRPYSHLYYEMKSHRPANLFARLIEWAARPEIGWLVEWTESAPAPALVAEVAKTLDASPEPIQSLARSATEPTKPQQNTTPDPQPVNNRSVIDQIQVDDRPPIDLPNLTLPNQTLPIIDRSIDRSIATDPQPVGTQATTRPSPTPNRSSDPLAKARDRMDRLIDDKVFLKEVCELATNLKKGKVHKHLFWHKATREEVWQIVFAGCVFGRECLENCMYTIANGTKQGPVLKPQKYIDASFRKMLHEGHGVSWEQLRNHIPVPAPPRPEPVPVSS